MQPIGFCEDRNDLAVKSINIDHLHNLVHYEVLKAGPCYFVAHIEESLKHIVTQIMHQPEHSEINQ